jgi:hypothetical protein
MLFIVGIAGILVANLIVIDKQNQTDQPTNLKKYVARHWANMLLSVIMVAVAIIAKQFIEQLEAAGKSLFLGIFSIGLSAPTIAQFVRDKTLQVLKTLSPASTGVPLMPDPPQMPGGEPGPAAKSSRRDTTNNL